MPRYALANVSPPQFSVGDRVFVQSRFPAGHVRTPLYLRGKLGMIIRFHGVFLDAEKLSLGQSGLPAVSLYQVAFNYREVWPKTPENSESTRILADLQENWLELANE